jgi:putative transposase
MGRRPPRLANDLYVGARRYFLTMCCENRRDVLGDTGACDLVVSELQRASDNHQFVVFAYCLMPDHLHLVTEGSSGASNCLAFAHMFKQRTAFQWRQQRGESLWQPGFYDHVLRDAEDTRAVVRYVLENPVRAKLVASPQDYRYSGSLVYERTELMEWAFGWSAADL